MTIKNVPDYPVVLLHSIGTDESLWHYQCDEFGSRLRLVTPLFPGHGARPPSTAASVEFWVEDLLAQLRVALWDSEPTIPVHLVGLSMGGVLALKFAATYPHLVKTLTVADSFACLDPDTAESKIRGVRKSLETYSMSDYATFYLNETLDSSQPDHVVGMLRSAISRVDSRSYLASAETCFHANLTRECSSLQVPTSVLIGSNDRKIPYMYSKQIHELVPNSSMVEIPRSGHLSCLDNPTEFNRALRDSFRRSQ